MRRHLALPFALSGFAGLVYETTWARLLRLAFGGTTAALSAVLAGFMGGLAIGAALGGRVADRRSPRAALRLYAGLELAVAALAAPSAFLLARLPEAYAALERATGAVPARAFAAAITVLPPAVLMGMTLPLLVRACVGLGEPLAAAVAGLYAVNTAGAVAGALATGFALMPWLGVSRSILCAALVNALAAALVYRIARADAVEAPVGETHLRAGVLAVSAADAGAGSDVAPSSGARRLLLVSAAVSGSVALGLEVLWTRTLVLTVGSSTQALALMLATLLAGIALGSAGFARLGLGTRAAGVLAAMFQVGVALSSTLLLRFASDLPYAYVALWERAHDSLAGLVALRLLPAAALMMVPTLLMGASLPALVKAAARSATSAGADVGSVYAANTAGAIAGSLLVGLVLLPRFGVARAVGITALAGLVGAAAAFAAVRRERGAKSAFAFAWLPAAAILLDGFGRGWDPRVMGRGVAYGADRAAELARAGQLHEALAGARVVYYGDGAESTVLVYDLGEDTLRTFVVNGRPEATTSPNDMRNQYLLGRLPALLHRGPVRDGLVIALGSGMTAGCLARHADRVTVVELEPRVLGAAATFTAWNHDVLHDPRVRVVVDDGRHFLLTSAQTYDVITVDPIHPSVAGSESLYSLEQYELVRRRLAAGGVAAQWLPLYQMGPDDARAIARTFATAFPDAQVWVNGSDAILLGGAGETLRPAAELAAELARPEVAESLGVVREARLGTLLAGYALGPAELARWVAGAPVSRDDRPVLEFSLPWQTYRDTVDGNLLGIFRFASGEPPPIDLAGLGADDLEALERSRAAVGADQIAIALRAAGLEEPMRAFFAEALDHDPDDALARQALRK